MADNSWMYGNPDVVAAYQKNVASRPVPVYTKAPDAPAKKGRKGIARFLPAAGAIGAGLLAAPLTGGASLAATLLALGLAGGAGGAVGEIGAEGLSGEKISPGKIAKEAAVSGLTSAIPFGGAVKTARVAGQVAEQGAEKAAAKGVTAKVANQAKDVGGQLESRAAGFGYGEKLAGRNPVRTAAQNKMFATRRAEGIKATGPRKIAQAVDDRLAELNPQITKKIAANDKRITISQAKDMSKKYLADVESQPEATKLVKKKAKEIADNMSRQVRSNSGVHSFRQGMDRIINYSKNPASGGLAAEQQAATIARRFMKNELDERVPGIAKLNTRYHDLSELGDYGTAGAGRLTRASESGGGGGGFFNALTKGDIATGLKGSVGAKINDIGMALEGGAAQAGKRGVVRTAVGETPKQLLGQPVASGVLGLAGALAGLNGGQPDQAPTDPLATDGATDPGATTTGTTAAAPLSLQDALQQAQQILGGNETPATYLAYAKELVSEDAAKSTAASGPNVTKVTSQQYFNATSGLQSLQKLSQLLQDDPGVLTRSATPGRQLPGVGGYISSAVKTGPFDALGYNVADTLLRIRTGATANETEIRKLQSQIMPRAGDSPETIQQKLATLQNAFQSITQLANGGGGQSASLTDALTQLQGVQ